MNGKQITDLALTNALATDDLLSLRKTGEQEDKKISYQNIKKSFGNSAIKGYVAISNEENKIQLTAVNAIKNQAYFNGMYVCFISPIVSNAFEVKIDDLGYKAVKVLNSNANAVIKENEYVVLVFINNEFKQVSIQSNMFTNDYVVTGFTIDQNNQFTNIDLTSAFGVMKTQYFEFMNCTFRCPANTKGVVRVRIDNISADYKDVFVNQLGADTVSFIPAQLYEDQIVHLVFDGVDFLMNYYDYSDNAIPLEPIYYNVENQKVEVQQENILSSSVTSLKDIVISQVKFAHIKERNDRKFIKDEFVFSNDTYSIEYDPFITTDHFEDALIPLLVDGIGLSSYRKYNPLSTTPITEVFFKFNSNTNSTDFTFGYTVQGTNKLRPIFGALKSYLINYTPVSKYVLEFNHDYTLRFNVSESQGTYYLHVFNGDFAIQNQKPDSTFYSVTLIISAGAAGWIQKTRIHLIRYLANDKRTVFQFYYQPKYFNNVHFVLEGISFREEYTQLDYSPTKNLIPGNKVTFENCSFTISGNQIPQEYKDFYFVVSDTLYNNLEFVTQQIVDITFINCSGLIKVVVHSNKKCQLKIQIKDCDNLVVLDWQNHILEPQNNQYILYTRE